MTVGKTHSGKSTFARELEKQLDNSIVIDQDNHAEFINTHYLKLRPVGGPNTFKYTGSGAGRNEKNEIIICFNSHHYG